MKRFERSSFMLACAATLAFASPAFAQINPGTIATRMNATTYTVQLTASPAGQVAYGNPVTLTAKVMQLPPNTVASGAVQVPNSHLRFTFKAQMTSPCAGMNPIAIATNAGPVAGWNPPKGGSYNVTVHVTAAHTLIPVIPRLPDAIGDAALNYVVTGGPATPNLPYVSIISTPVVPPSGGATAPADVTISLNLNAPSYPVIYKLSAGCETAGGTSLPCTWTATNYYSSVPVTFPPLHLASSGQYLLAVSGLMIRQSDCQATGVVYTHTNQYIVH
jgi:hypothetical protein